MPVLNVGRGQKRQRAVLNPASNTLAVGTMANGIAVPLEWA
jgi:hypothetical protein